MKGVKFMYCVWVHVPNSRFFFHLKYINADTKKEKEKVEASG